MEHIKSRWDEYQKNTFPEGIHGKSIDGINLTLLHCDTASCVMTAINMDGMLSTRSKKQLKSCIETIEKILGDLNEEQREFFNGLLTIAKDVDKKIGPVFEG